MKTQTNSTQQTSKPGSSIYYSCLFLSSEQRANLAPLINFCWRVERISRFSQEAEVVSRQLSWWQKEVVQCFTSEASHPIILEFSSLDRLFLENTVQNQDRQNAELDLTNTLVNSISHLLSLQTDCQIDDEQAFEEHALQKRGSLIGLASKLSGTGTLSDKTLLTASKLLTSIDIVDGFHLDGINGTIALPLNQIIDSKLTIDQLTNKNGNTENFWKNWSDQISEYYQQLWDLSTKQHPSQKTSSLNNPLLLSILIYSGLRLAALKISLKKTPNKNSNCYNCRPTISPLKKFWLSWRIRSYWLSGKPPLRILQHDKRS